MLRTDHLSFGVGRFHLSDVSLEVGEGEYFVLMGQTGSGKSILAKCICGLIRADSGRIVVSGRDVTDLEPRRRRLGYVPQEGALFANMNVEANITFAPRLKRRRRFGPRISRAEALRGVSEIIEMLSLGPLLHRRVTTLSGGERQKVALARALAAEPEALILDEPVSALDEPGRREVCGELLRVQRRVNIATIHICHNTEEAELLADCVGVLHQGRLVQAGGIEELRRTPCCEAVAKLLPPPDASRA
ncbi:MAG: ATP-binding cassette domain-containing protein [Planctomycetes bacterium]|nr:ATP-binding cassette domain-containing protein [Planctomycetota bacterium]